ncbi:aminotransferase class I/II-fold pyridoxal phosphate-dependent enzyme [Neobacillus mesonae]|uniref:aminotransferase class I/II-fold pyridoxal phosphate-dependent enzyme n=1 Tax=Neobacillus mesonae TaxID=1193713 RepID=UPI002042574C|nr:aminotransferase class I/II-fold pyridoxal phosphate-dependent enzyme [Neobacillus mesonae]MCM3570828.1 aminotransferase class I/II-fold pyridoxal phosphate-dependent enzyme [Neobacillus mesonae]
MNAQLRMPLIQALIKHIKGNPISFHVPGHKYGRLMSEEFPFFKKALQLDATELSGLDDLHAPEGAILEAESLLAELYQAGKSYFLVNGSTVGNLAMTMAACSENDIVLVQRNCHKSILNALQLSKVNPVFLEPDYDPVWKTASGVSRNSVRKAIQLYPKAKAVIVTYPNYYGMVFDLSGIIEEAHEHQIPVLVDEAHGAHFIIGGPFPKSAVTMGADIVVQSAHKTLPAMTMGSFLHWNSSLVPNEKLEHYLKIFQSSSPSYLIMASLDIARHYAAGYRKQDLDYLLERIKSFKNQLMNIPAIKVLEYPEVQEGDFLKITIQSRCSLNGFELQKELEASTIYTELADPNNILLVLPLLKNGQAYPLEEAAMIIKKVTTGYPIKERDEEYRNSEEEISRLAIDYHQLLRLKKEYIGIEQSVGRICAEQVIPYPPGVPLLLQGEQITDRKLLQLKKLLHTGARFQGGALLKERQIQVFKV